MLMAPKMGTETLSPLFPSCLYSAVGRLELPLLAMVAKVRIEGVCRRNGLRKAVALSMRRTTVDEGLWTNEDNRKLVMGYTLS